MKVSKGFYGRCIFITTLLALTALFPGYSQTSANEYEGTYIITEALPDGTDFVYTNETIGIGFEGGLYLVGWSAWIEMDAVDNINAPGPVKINNGKLIVILGAFEYHIVFNGSSITGTKKALNRLLPDETIGLVKVNYDELFQLIPLNYQESSVPEEGCSNINIDASEEYFLFPSTWVEINRNGNVWSPVTTGIKLELWNNGGEYRFSIAKGDSKKEEFVIDLASESDYFSRQFFLVGNDDEEYILDFIYQEDAEGIALWDLPKIGPIYLVHNDYSANYAAQFTNPDQYEDDSSIIKARRLMSGNTPADVVENHTIHNVDDEDWFIFFASRAMQPVIQVMAAENGNGVETVIAIFDSRRKMVFSSSASKSITLTKSDWKLPRAVGEYFLRITSAAHESGEYILKLDY